MLPFAFVLHPTTSTDQERIRIRDADRLKPDTMEVFPWTVTEFDAFLVDRTGISIGKVRTSTSILFAFPHGPHFTISAE